MISSFLVGSKTVDGGQSIEHHATQAEKRIGLSKSIDLFNVCHGHLKWRTKHPQMISLGNWGLRIESSLAFQYFRC